MSLSWTDSFRKTILGTAADQLAGTSVDVALAGDGTPVLAVVGEPGFGTNKGRVRIYQYNVLEGWSSDAVKTYEGAADNDLFGSSVSIAAVETEGTGAGLVGWIAIGAPGADAAYLVDFSSDDTNVFNFPKAATADAVKPTLGATGKAGASVAVSFGKADPDVNVTDDYYGYLVVGIPENSYGTINTTKAGVVNFVKLNQNNTWGNVSTYKYGGTPPGADAFLGCDVDIISIADDEHYAIVGERGLDSGKGAVHILSFTTAPPADAVTTTASANDKRIDSAVASAAFGTSVAISGVLKGAERHVVAAVGAPGEDTGKGKVHVYHRTTGGTMTATDWAGAAVSTLAPTTGLPVANNGNFGQSVDIHIGLYDLNGTDTPFSFFIAGAPTNTITTGTAPNTTVYASAGTAYIYKGTLATGWSWAQHLSLSSVPLVAGDRFGAAVSMGIAATSQQGGFALVGASHANVASAGDDAGAVYVYRYGSGAVGGGDPHIIPIFNPERQVYMLPPNNSVYKYFDNLSADPSDRLVINCQMWVLPVELVQRAAQYQAHGAEVPADLMAELRSRTNVRYDNFKAADTSFAKYLSIMHGDRTLLFDMDTLEPVTTFMNFDSVDGAAARYALIPQPAEDVHEILEGSQITLGPIVQDTQSLFYLDKMHVPHHNNDRKRVVTVRTRTHGDISVVLMTRNDVGHRNEVRLDMCSVGLSQESCVGTLVRIDQREVVPGLTFVHNNPEDSRAWSTDEATLTLDQFRPLLAREARKQRAGVRAGLERRSAALDASISTVAAVEIDMPVA